MNTEIEEIEELIQDVRALTNSLKEKSKHSLECDSE